MLRSVLLMAFFVSLAVAAPVPTPSEKERIVQFWGRTAGKGEFELKGKLLTIRGTTPQDGGLIAYGAQDTAPRTGRTVAGDFEVTVKVLDAATPDKDAKHTDACPTTRAGLYVSGGGYAVKVYLSQHYPRADAVRGEPTREVWVESWTPRGTAGNPLKPAAPGKSTWLRISRKGTAVTVSCSFDGEEWSKPQTPTPAPKLPDEVTVGVYLSQTTEQPVHATFDALTVGKPKGERAKYPGPWYDEVRREPEDRP